jgi:hypothetical protein
MTPAPPQLPGDAAVAGLAARIPGAVNRTMHRIPANRVAFISIPPSVVHDGAKGVDT